VDEPDRDKFEALVQRIVFFKLSQGQLDESGLSLADLHKVTATIVDTLSNMYHARIKYPWQTESTGAIASQTPPEGQEPPAPAPEPPAPAPEPSPETEAPQPEPSAPSPAPEPTPDTYTGPAPAPPRNTLPAHGKPPEDES